MRQLKPLTKFEAAPSSGRGWEAGLGFIVIARVIPTPDQPPFPAGRRTAGPSANRCDRAGSQAPAPWATPVIGPAGRIGFSGTTVLPGAVNLRRTGPRGL